MSFEYVEIGETRFVIDCNRVRKVEITGFIHLHPMDRVPRHTLKPADAGGELNWNQCTISAFYPTQEATADAMKVLLRR